MKITLLSIGVLLLVPMQSWSGSDEKGSLASIAVDPRATLTIRYPGDDRPLHWEHGPPIRPDIPVVEGQRVPISRLPDGSCPKVTAEIQTYPDEPEAFFEDDGRHLWYPASSSQMSEEVDVEHCEVIVAEAKAQIRWQRIEIRRSDARARKQLEAVGLKIPISRRARTPTAR